MPNWLIGVVLLAIAIWRINGALKYSDQQLFLKEVGGDWIDRDRLPEAIKTFIRIEALFFISLSIFPFLTYINFLHSYLWHIAITNLVLFGLPSIWWILHFSAKRKQT